MKNAKKLIGATVMLLVSLFAVVTSTFAWLTVQNTPEVGNINFSATNGDAVYFSLDGTNWSNNMTGNDIYEFLGLYTTDAQGNKTYRFNYKDVTPSATGDGFIATFNALEETLNPGVGMNVYSYHDVTAAVPTAKAETQNITVQNSTGTVPNEQVYTNRAGYVAFTLHIRAVNNSYLYLYGANAKATNAQSAADNAAAKMLRIGFATSATKTSVLRIYNPVVGASLTNDVTDTDTQKKMSDMFKGDFYARDIIENLFRDLINKTAAADNFLVPDLTTVTPVEDGDPDPNTFTYYTFNSDNASVQNIETAVTKSYNVNLINGVFYRATGGALTEQSITSTKAQVGEPLAFIPAYDSTSETTINDTVLKLTVYLWLEGWSNSATDAARTGNFNLDLKFIGLEENFVKGEGIVESTPTTSDTDTTE